MKKHFLLAMIIVPLTENEKLCHTLPLIVDAKEQDIPTIKQMLETHYQHSEFIEHLIHENYRPSLYNQAIIKDLNTLMKQCEKVEVSFHLPNINLKPIIDQKIAKLQKKMNIHLYENTLCLN